jgi:hypothetical protein
MSAGTKSELRTPGPSPGVLISALRDCSNGAGGPVNDLLNFVGIGLIVLSSCVGVSNGPSCELEGLPSACATRQLYTMNGSNSRLG